MITFPFYILISASVCSANFSFIQPIVDVNQFRTEFTESQSALLPDGRPYDINLNDIGHIVVHPIIFVPQPGLTAGFKPRWCGVAIVENKRPPIGLVTIGAGPTDTVTCDGILNARLITLHKGRPLIYLLYRTASPNASGKTPVILRRDRESHKWVVDEQLTVEIGEVEDLQTLPRIRQWLERNARPE